MMDNQCGPNDGPPVSICISSAVAGVLTPDLFIPLVVFHACA